MFSRRRDERAAPSAAGRSPGGLGRRSLCAGSSPPQEPGEVEYPLPGSVASCDGCGEVVQRYYHCSDCAEATGLFDLCVRCCGAFYLKSGPALKIDHPTHEALKLAADREDTARSASNQAVKAAQLEKSRLEAYKADVQRAMLARTQRQMEFKRVDAQGTTFKTWTKEELKMGAE